MYIKKSDTFGMCGNVHKLNYIITNFAHKSLSSSYAKLLENLFGLLKCIERDSKRNVWSPVKASAKLSSFYQAWNLWIAGPKITLYDSAAENAAGRKRYEKKTRRISEWV